MFHGAPMCVHVLGTPVGPADFARAVHGASSSRNDNGALLYKTKIFGGSTDESQYPHNSVVGCAVCSVPPERGSVYPRWGKRNCPTGAKMLYSGFMAGAWYSHSGSGYNDLCMHPNPQSLPAAESALLSHFADLHGMEYETTGAADKSHNVDAACAMCEAPGVAFTYVAWG